MTIITTDYFDILNSNARAIYGKYHPKDWHGVESYLRSNPDWECPSSGFLEPIAA